MNSYPEPYDPSGREHHRQVYAGLTNSWFQKHHQKPWFHYYLENRGRGDYQHWYQRINYDYNRWRREQQRTSQWNEQRYAMYQDRSTDWKRRY